MAPVRANDDVRAAPPIRRRLGVVVSALCLGTIATWLWVDATQDGTHTDSADIDRAPDGPANSTAGSVGSAVCAACHAEIAESYREHPMANSLTLADRVANEGLPEGEVPPGETARCEYRAEFHKGRMVHHERMCDADGEVIYDQAVPMDYAVGSGRRAKAFVYRRGDSLFMSPLNWYSQLAKWDLAPGYVPDDPRRFDRRVTDDCLGCHSGRVAAVGRSLNRYRDPVFHEMSIGCENCHGPGAAHVAFHESGPQSAGQSDPIVNPAKLDPVRRESVCTQCHLQAAVRLKRPGRSDFDFRPGQRLDEVWSVLDIASAADAGRRTKAVSHVQQMRASRCFSVSEGGFDCTSCHDPHSVPAADARDAFYRGRCLECHRDDSCTASTEQRAARQDSCIACHMPARAASNIPHVAQTDHRVLRVPDPSAGDQAELPADTLMFVNPSDLAREGWERDRALALGAWLHLSNQGRQPPQELAQVLRGVLNASPDDGTVLTVLGSMALDRGQTELARGYYERALRDPASEEAALSALLKIHYLASDGEPALHYANRLIALDPGNARAHAMRADVLAGRGRSDEAIAAARRALDFNPTLVPVRQWLVQTCRAAGRTAEAREHEQVLQRMSEMREVR